MYSSSGLVLFLLCTDWLFSMHVISHLLFYTHFACLCREFYILVCLTQYVRCAAHVIRYALQGRFTLTRIIRANNSREHSRSSFGLSIHTHANANVRTNNSCEQFASFALSNTIRANNWRINPIFTSIRMRVVTLPS